MRSLIISFLFLASLPAVAQHAAWPVAGDRAALANLNANAHIVVETSEPARSADKCRLVSFTADTITCSADARPHDRLVFPMRQVEAVYRVRGRDFTVLIVMLSLVGIFVGSVAAEWAPGIALGIVASLIAIGAAQLAPPFGVRGGVWGAPQPPPQVDSHLVLIYHR